MSSFSGICEIIEAKEELDPVQRSKGTKQLNSSSRMDEKAGKLPMLKTGRNYALEDDLNQLFDAIDFRTSGKGLGQSHQSDRGTSSKSDSKKPIRVGAPQASGIGISESVTLKQALRRLCISHASEMAAMKRLSKPTGLSGVSEAGAIKKLYRSVVVEAGESGLPLNEGKGRLVEISLVPEKRTEQSPEYLPDSLPVIRTKSPNPSALTSPRIAIPTPTRVTRNKTPPRDEITPTRVTRIKTPPPRSEITPTRVPRIKTPPPRDEITPARVKTPPPRDEITPARVARNKTPARGEKTPTRVTRSKTPSRDEITPRRITRSKTPARDGVVPEPTEVGGGKSTSKLGPKGKSKATPCSSKANTIKEVLELDEIVPAPTEVGSEASKLEVGLVGKRDPSPSLSSSNAVIKVSKSAGTRSRSVKPDFRHRSFVKKKGKQDSVSPSSGSSTFNEGKKDELVPSTSNLVCHTHNSNEKNTRKESVSPASSGTCFSVEVCSSTVNSTASKPAFSSNSCNDGTVGVKVGNNARSREKGEFSQSSKSSIGEYSSSTSFSEESNLSGSGCNGNRPHMSKDLRWDAIRHVETRSGSLGLKHFKLLKRLGCGDIGTVYLAELTGTNCPFALKVMDNEFLACRKKMPRAQTERDILQMLDHPFLPTLYAYFTTDKFSCLVMEYCPGGDLHVLRQRQPSRCFSEQAARFYVAEVLLALEYLHMLGVVYRDLKPENILVREDGHIMLSDFDLSLRCSVSPMLLQASSLNMEPTKKLSGPCAESSCINPICLHPSWVQASCFSPRLTSATPRRRKAKSDLAAQIIPLPQLVAEPTSARSNSFVGTHEYLAPEIIKGEGHGSAVDWWTFGIFLYELLYGKTPFKGLGNEDTLANVVTQSLKFPEGPLVSFQARDLIRGLLVKDPENRLGSVKGATEIKQHPFFEGLNWALIRCAIPPELPQFCDPIAPPAVTCEREEDNEEEAEEEEESKCIEFKATGEHLEFELF